MDIVSGHLGQTIACIIQNLVLCHGKCLSWSNICTIMFWPIGFLSTQKKNICHFYQCDIYTFVFHEIQNCGKISKLFRVFYFLSFAHSIHIMVEHFICNVDHGLQLVLLCAYGATMHFNTHEAISKDHQSSVNITKWDRISEEFGIIFQSKQLKITFSSVSTTLPSIVVFSFSIHFKT